jgi:hypothetical protein
MIVVPSTRSYARLLWDEKEYIQPSDFPPERVDGESASTKGHETTHHEADLYIITTPIEPEAITISFLNQIDRIERTNAEFIGRR